MNESDKIFKVGMIVFIVVLIITILFQVLYRDQNRKIKKINKRMKEVNRLTEIKQAKFSQFVSNDNLHIIVKSLNLNYERLNFDKVINIGDLDK